MAVSYRCPNPGCGVALKTPLRVPGGKSVGCPKCGAQFVAEPPQPPDDTSIPRAAEATPVTRAQGVSERDRLAPGSIRAVEPIRLGLEPGAPVPGLSSWLLDRQLGVG